MPKLNLLVFLNSYSDNTSTNNPDHNGIKWTRAIDAIPVMDAGQTMPFTLAPGETKALFDTTRVLAQDNTTQYSLALSLTNPNTYTLSAVGGTLPNFRTPRSTGADATTQVTVTLNGPVATFASTAGTPFSLGSVVVGDKVRIGNLFNVLNQGEWKVIAVTGTSFSVANPTAAGEGPIALGSGFADQVQIYSAAGVQINDTLVINAGFSPVSQASYIITSVSANSLSFYTTAILPQESNVMTEIAIYESAKNLVYLEANQNCSLTINGVAAGNIEPWVILNGTKPGQYMRKSTIYSMSVTNTSTNAAYLVFASVE